MILSYGTCFLHQKKCSCSPYAFSILKILLHSLCHMYSFFYIYIFCPFTLLLFKMPHNTKGTSSLSCFQNRVSAAIWKAYLIWILFNRCSSFRSEPSMRGRHPKDPANTPYKEVAFSQQHSQLQREEQLNLFSLFLRMWYFPDVREWKLVHAVILIFLTNLTWACFFSFLCIVDAKREKKPNPESDWSASFSAWSPRQCPHRHQHFVYSLTVMLCLFCWGMLQYTSTQRLAQFVGSE